MARITDKNQQLNRWLARLFPPSSPTYMQPSEIRPDMNLMLHALPSSLVYERMGYQTGATTNPGTELFFPSTVGLESFGTVQQGVPNGKFYWVMAARFESATQLVGTEGKAFIGLKNTASVREMGLAQGVFGVTAFTDFVDLRGGVNKGTAGPQTIMSGAGGGPVAIPPGYCVHFSTAAVPAAATIFFATICYCVMDIGEIHP